VEKLLRAKRRTLREGTRVLQDLFGEVRHDGSVRKLCSFLT